MRRTIVVVLVMLLVAMTPAPAGADRALDRDADDTAGLLDIARIVHKHRKRRPNVFVHKIVMYDRWTNSAISSPHDSRRITVTFDVRRAGYGCIGCITEREVVITSQSGDLRAVLYNHLGDPPRKLADLRVWRPNDRTVAFSVRKRQLMRKDRNHYDWGVGTIYQRRGDQDCPPRRSCFDYAPRRRELLRHQL